MKNILSILTAAAVLTVPMSTAAWSDRQNDDMVVELLEQKLCNPTENTDNVETALETIERLKDSSGTSFDCKELLKGLWDKLSDCDKLPELPDELPEAPETPEAPEQPSDPEPSFPDLPSGGETQNPIPDDDFADSGEDSADFLSSDARQILSLVNAYRAENGIAPVKADVTVQKAAQLRAEELPISFSHTRPNGSRCFTALEEVGASYQGAGENIAAGQTSPEEVMNDWMNSDGHRANILNEAFTTLGIGVYTDANGRIYRTQMFTY